MPAFDPPFVQITRFSAAPWWVGLDGDEPEALAETLDGWDPSRLVRAKRTVELAPNDIARQTGLGAKSVVRVAAGWYCDATRTRVFCSDHTFTLDERERELQLALEIQGSEIASAVELLTQFVLVEAAEDSRSTAARVPGSVLYSDSAKVHVEGVASRFPMEWIAFEEAGFPTKAAWFLDWDPTAPHNSVLGGLRIYFNASHPRLSKLLEAEDEKTAMLLEIIHVDIVRQIVTGVSESVEFNEHRGEFDEGTIGQLARRILRIYFPGYSTTALVALRRTDHARFEAGLQGAARLLGGGSW